MTETFQSTDHALGASAGTMLREARERQGMHIAMLAAMMKVTPRKLEALEADRYEELPDLAFARALAQTVCRTLKMNPEPVMAKLPMLSKPEGLAHAAQGLNTPFREHGSSGHSDPQKWALLRRPAFWATLLVLAAAAAMALAPPAWLSTLTGASRSVASPTSVSVPLGPQAPAATVTEVLKPANVPAQPLAGPVVQALPTAASPAPAVVVATAPKTDLMGPPRPGDGETLVETVHAAPPALSTAAVEAAVSGVLVIRTKAEAWVEVSDARGRSLIARSLQAGETVGIDGDAPFRVRLGNAANTELRFRGAPVDLSTRSTGNLARFELK